MTNELLFLLKTAKMKSNLVRRDLWVQWHSLTLDQYLTHHQHPLAGPGCATEQEHQGEGCLNSPGKR